MMKRRRHATRPLFVAAWTLIWFGTIFAVDAHALLSRIGVLLWGAGMIVQLVIVSRWRLGGPGSGPFTATPAAG